jgi:hypothetical protein
VARREDHHPDLMVCITNARFFVRIRLAMRRGFNQDAGLNIITGKAGLGMPHKEIKTRIGELKSELQQTSKDTSLLEEALDQAREGIERYTPEAIQELVANLQHETKEFEVEHPRITALINQVTTALSNLGI